MLGELLDHTEGAQAVASRITQEYPEYEAMAVAVRSATATVGMACEPEKPTADAQGQLIEAC